MSPVGPRGRLPGELVSEGPRVSPEGPGRTGLRPQKVRSPEGEREGGGGEEGSRKLGTLDGRKTDPRRRSPVVYVRSPSRPVLRRRTRPNVADWYFGVEEQPVPRRQTPQGVGGEEGEGEEVEGEGGGGEKTDLRLQTSRSV